MTPAQVKAARTLLSLTQKEFAQALGLTDRTVVNIESKACGYSCKRQTALAIECLLRRRSIWGVFEWQYMKGNKA